MRPSGSQQGACAHSGLRASTILTRAARRFKDLRQSGRRRTLRPCRVRANETGDCKEMKQAWRVQNRRTPGDRRRASSLGKSWCAKLSRDWRTPSGTPALGTTGSEAGTVVCCTTPYGASAVSACPMIPPASGCCHPSVPPMNEGRPESCARFCDFFLPMRSSKPWGRS